MAPLVGKRGSIDERGINDFGQADALEILEKNPPLPEYAAKNDEYLEKLNQYESYTSALERADIDPNSLKGKTNEEVGEIIGTISEYEDVLGVPVPRSLGSTVEEIPVGFYEEDALIVEPRMPSNFINKVNETPPDFAGNINLNKIDSPDDLKSLSPSTFNFVPCACALAACFGFIFFDLGVYSSFKSEPPPNNSLIEASFCFFD